MLSQALRIIPLPFQAIQAIASILLIGDVIFLFILFLNILKSILKYVCYSIMIIFFVMLALYIFNEYQRQQKQYRVDREMESLVVQGGNMMG